MDSVNWWDTGLNLIGWIAGGGIIFVYNWLNSKLNSLKDDFKGLDNKLVEGLHSVNSKQAQSNLEILQNKLEAQKSYVERAEYYSIMDKFDRRLEKLSDDLGGKIDTLANTILQTKIHKD